MSSFDLVSIIHCLLELFSCQLGVSRELLPFKVELNFGLVNFSNCLPVGHQPSFPSLGISTYRGTKYHGGIIQSEITKWGDKTTHEGPTWRRGHQIKDH